MTEFLSLSCFASSTSFDGIWWNELMEKLVVVMYLLWCLWCTLSLRAEFTGWEDFFAHSSMPMLAATDEIVKQIGAKSLTKKKSALLSVRVVPDRYCVTSDCVQQHNLTVWPALLLLPGASLLLSLCFTTFSLLSSDDRQTCTGKPISPCLVCIFVLDSDGTMFWGWGYLLTYKGSVVITGFNKCRHTMNDKNWQWTL